MIAAMVCSQLGLLDFIICGCCEFIYTSVITPPPVYRGGGVLLGVSVCVFVSPPTYLRNFMSDQCRWICVHVTKWPLFDPCMGGGLRYVMYFRVIRFSVLSFQLLARWPGTHCRILSGIQRAAQTVLGVYLKRTCSRVTTPWVKKARHQTLGHNFTNYYPIFNHSEIRIAINDEGSIAKNFRCDESLYYTFITHFAGERIFKIGEHLAKLRAKSLTVSYTPFALHAFLSSKMLISPDKLNNLCWITVIKRCYVNRQINVS